LGKLIGGLAILQLMNYSVYAIEKGGKFLKSDLRHFTPAPLAAIHFTNYSRAAERAHKRVARWSRSPFEHPGIGDVFSTHVISVERG
jgi:hypothetical protein